MSVARQTADRPETWLIINELISVMENLAAIGVPVESCAKDMKYIVVHNTANDDIVIDGGTW